MIPSPNSFLLGWGGISAGGINFSPDRQWVAYTNFPEGTLWKMKLDGSQRVQLTFTPLEVSTPRWSPDGQCIAFMGRQNGHAWRVFVISSAGGAAPEEIIPESGIQAAPDWSPDGRTIVFSGLSEDITGDANDTAIHMMNVDTRKTELLPSSEGLFCARWSPAGPYISATASDGTKLMLFDLTTQKWTVLANLPTGCSNWSRDGQYVYFQTLNVKGPAVYRLAMKNRTTEMPFNIDIRLADAPLPWWSGLGPDDSVFLLRDQTSEEIYALDSDFP
jgi:Tol biopolymer transport system component